MANKKKPAQNGSQSVKWSSTRHTGVRYWESETRKYQGRQDKCYVIRYKNQGRSFSETIGWQSEGITPEYCSTLRGQITSNIKKGESFHSLQEKRNLDVAKRTAEKSEAVTLGRAFQDFLRTRTLKARTIRDYERSIEIAFKDWKQRRVIDITRDMIARKHTKLRDDALSNYKKERTDRKKKKDGIAKKDLDLIGNAQANQHMRFLRSLMNFCAGYYEDAEGGPLIKFNPVKRLSETKAWFRVPRKQTVIKEHELPVWFRTVTGLKNETVRDYLLFLLFTGSRKEEGLTLEVEQVDLKSRDYTMLDPKNRQPLTLPIPNYLFSVISKRIKNLKETKYIFPGIGDTGHLVEPKRQVAKVINESGVSFTLSDLRRHYITLADSLDLSLFCIKRLVNHSIGSDVTSGYVVSDVKRLRGPMQKIEDRILFLAGAKEPGKVVTIRKSG